MRFYKTGPRLKSSVVICIDQRTVLSLTFYFYKKNLFIVDIFYKKNIYLIRLSSRKGVGGTIESTMIKYQLPACEVKLIKKLRRHDIQHNDTRPNDIQHTNKYSVTLSIMAISIPINKTQYSA